MPNYRKGSNARRPRNNQAQTSSLGWVWLFLGMFLGIGTAVLLYGVFTQQLSFESLKKVRTANRNQFSNQTQIEQKSGPSHSNKMVARSSANGSSASGSSASGSSTTGSNTSASGSSSSASNSSTSGSKHGSHQQAAHRGDVHQKGHNSQKGNAQNTQHNDQKEQKDQYEFYTLLPGMEVQLPDVPNKKQNHAKAKNVVANRDTNSRKESHEALAEHNSSSKKEQRALNEKANVKHDRHNRAIADAEVTGTQDTALDTLQNTNQDQQQQTEQRLDQRLEQRRDSSTQPASKDKQAQNKNAQIKNPHNKNDTKTLALASQNSHSSHSTNNAMHSAARGASKPHEAKVQTKIAAIQYIVQAGLFPEPQKADELKAKLTLQGFNTHIQKVRNQAGKVGYRVTLGPFSEEPAALLQKQKLQDQKINGILILQRTQG